MLFWKSGRRGNIDSWDANLPVPEHTGGSMNRIIYIVGLIVVIVFILGFLGLR